MSGADRPRATVPRYHLVRRAFGIGVCALPVLLAVAGALWSREVPATREVTGLVLVGVAGLVAGLNLYLAYLRPWRYRRRYGSQTGDRFVSGLPLVGTLFSVGGCLVAFGSAPVGWIGLVATLADPDGVPWIPVRTWRDASLWDA
jgi:hypothetical protein